MTSRPSLRRLCGIALALLLAAGAFNARAGDFGVSPLKLLLGAHARSGAFTVSNSNDGATPLTFQVELARWTENARGDDVYRPSHALVFFPQQFQIPPHQNRIIRVGDRNPALRREHAYRLFIEEIPNPGTSQRSKTGVTIALRFGVPVFVRPPATALHGVLAALDVSRGHASALVRNLGAVHFRLSRIRFVALGTGGKVLYAHALTGWYLLAGAERRYRVALPAAACRGVRTLRVEATGDRLKLSAEQPIAAGSCSQRGARSR